jgi:hypothetical protein
MRACPQPQPRPGAGHHARAAQAPYEAGKPKLGRCHVRALGKLARAMQIARFGRNPGDQTDG